MNYYQNFSNIATLEVVKWKNLDFTNNGLIKIIINPIKLLE